MAGRGKPDRWAFWKQAVADDAVDPLNGEEDLRN
jgi:hypothetical protein